MLCYVTKVMKVADVIKVANQLMLKQRLPGGPNMIISILKNGRERQKSRSESYTVRI